jgi:hypothetical protein
MKPGNAGGAKECREVEARRVPTMDRHRLLVPARAMRAGDADALVGSLSRTIADNCAAADGLR